MKKNLALGISMCLLIFLSSFVVFHTTNAHIVVTKQTALKQNKVFDAVDVGYWTDASTGQKYHAYGDEWGNVTTVYASDIFFEDEPEYGDLSQGGSFAWNTCQDAYAIEVTYYLADNIPVSGATSGYSGFTLSPPF